MEDLRKTATSIITLCFVEVCAYLYFFGFSYGFIPVFAIVVFTVIPILWSLSRRRNTQDFKKEEQKKESARIYSKEDRTFINLNLLTKEEEIHLRVFELPLKKHSRKELKNQYRLLAKKYHPDITGGSPEKMLKINTSRDFLLKK